jgi:hypothetical protein
VTTFRDVAPNTFRMILAICWRRPNPDDAPASLTGRAIKMAPGVRAAHFQPPTGIDRELNGFVYVLVRMTSTLCHSILCP